MDRHVMGDEWVVTLGKAHRARDRAVVQAAKAASDHTEDTTRVSLERWTSIVAAMAQLITAYNVSVGRNALHLTEDRSDPNRPVVAIEGDGETAPTLVATLDEAVICVCTCDADGVSSSVERRLLPDRDDRHTAAYLLQHWLTHL